MYIPFILLKKKGFEKNEEVEKVTQNQKSSRHKENQMKANKIAT